MAFLEHLIDFTTVEEGEQNLQKALKLRDLMGGALYYNVINDDCIEIERKLIKIKEGYRRLLDEIGKDIRFQNPQADHDNHYF